MSTDPTDPGYVAQDDKAALLKRLRRVEGQVRGLQRMVEDDTYCIDVLTQVTAVKRALEKVSLMLVDDHLRGCVLDAAKSGDPDAADVHLAEATNAIARLLKA
ncbi:metal-sensitive transcriptional regulator [Euzebya rosea]|uniref:metal-sensitive transcriptional regulator n=1 Tax=Euzebya rosea TaxID=2052804 RepID=UPI00196B3175|nr:metal-sensitive transcriptional regulator [Euzebya rosea]